MKLLNKLDRLAGEATRDMEAECQRWQWVADTVERAFEIPSFAAHIAANDPDTVRALVRVARAAEGERLARGDMATLKVGGTRVGTFEEVGRRWRVAADRVDVALDALKNGGEE